MSDNDRNRGLYGKYRIERLDGSSAAGGKHESCQYFVLDLTHDKHAIAALAAYAISCNDDFPILSNDLRAIVDASIDLYDCNSQTPPVSVS